MKSLVIYHKLISITNTLYTIFRFLQHTFFLIFFGFGFYEEKKLKNPKKSGPEEAKNFIVEEKKSGRKESEKGLDYFLKLKSNRNRVPRVKLDF